MILIYFKNRSHVVLLFLHFLISNFPNTVEYGKHSFWLRSICRAEALAIFLLALASEDGIGLLRPMFPLDTGYTNGGCSTAACAEVPCCSRSVAILCEGQGKIVRCAGVYRVYSLVFVSRTFIERSKKNEDRLKSPAVRTCCSSGL